MPSFVDHLRSVPALLGVATFVLTSGAGFLLVTADGDQTVPSAAPVVAEAAPAAPSEVPAPAPVPSLASETASAPEAATAPPSDAVPEPLTSPSSVPASAPAPPPARDPDLVDATSGRPLVNPGSKPIEAVAPAPTAPPAPSSVILPVGHLYQRIAPGDTGTSFTPVESLPSDASVVSLIQAVFPQSEWERAELVAGCESGMRSVTSKPNRNGSRDHGVFQLNDGGTLQGLLKGLGEDETDHALALDPAWNVRAAHLLWTQRGWQPWTCSSKVGITDGLYSSRPGPRG